MILTALALVWLPTVTAQARLGETPEQIEGRFGKPISDIKNHEMAMYPNQRNAQYKSDNFSISVVFLNEKAEIIIYASTDEFSSEQISQLLENNRQGAVWGDSTREHSGIIWKRSDGAKAEYKIETLSRAYYSLRVISAYMRKLDEERERKEQDTKRRQEQERIKKF